MRKCPRCGKLYQDDTRLCSNCNVETEPVTVGGMKYDGQEVYEKKTFPKKSMDTGKIIIGIIMMVIIAVGGFIFISQKDNASDHAEEPDQHVIVSDDYAEQGDNYFDTKDYNNAIVAYTKAIDKNGGNANLYHRRGVCYQRTDKTDEAIEDYNRAIKAQKDYPYPYYNLGYIYHNQGNFAKAINYYSEALKYKKDDADFWSNRGKAYEDSKNYSKASADYKQALKVDPNHQYAKEGLERIAKKTK